MRWATVIFFVIVCKSVLPTPVSQQNSGGEPGIRIYSHSSVKYYSGRRRGGSNDNVQISSNPGGQPAHDVKPFQPVLSRKRSVRKNDTVSDTLTDPLTDHVEFAESNPILDVLKVLKAPGVSGSSTVVPVSSPTPVPPPKNLLAILSQLRRSDETPQQLSPVALALSESLSPATKSQNEAGSPPSKFSSGNALLDNIMNCPCPAEQLSRIGVRSAQYSVKPDPDLYREPPYGPDMRGPGDVIATDLKHAGGKTGNVFGQIIRLLLGLPAWALSVLKPLISGVVDTAAQTTEAAAGVIDDAAKQVPKVFRSTGAVAKKLLNTVGDVSGSLLQIVANIIAAVGAAKTSLAGTLPFGFDIIGDLTKMFGGMVGTIIDFLNGTLEPLSNGIVQAGKTGGNIFSGLVEGTKGFQNGLLEGIKYGVNDEQPPAGEGGYWKRHAIQ